MLRCGEPAQASASRRATTGPGVAEAHAARVNRRDHDGRATARRSSSNCEGAGGRAGEGGEGPGRGEGGGDGDEGGRTTDVVGGCCSGGSAQRREIALHVLSVRKSD